MFRQTTAEVERFKKHHRAIWLLLLTFVARGTNAESSLPPEIVQAQLLSAWTESLQAYENREFERAARAIVPGLELAQEMGYPLGEAQFSMQAALSFIFIDPPRGLEYFQNARRLCEVVGDSWDCYGQLNEWVWTALAISSTIQELSTSQEKLLNLGFLTLGYWGSHQYWQARNFSIQAANLAREIEASRAEAQLSIIAGLSLGHIKQQREAVPYLERAIELCQEVEEVILCPSAPFFLHSTLSRLGVPSRLLPEDFLSADAYDSLRTDLREVVNLFEPGVSEKEQGETILRFFSNLAEEEDWEELKTALPLIRRLLEREPLGEDKKEMLRILKELMASKKTSQNSVILPGSGSFGAAVLFMAEGRLEEAQEKLKMAYNTALQAGYLPQQSQALSYLAGIYWDKNEKQKALAAVEKAVQIHEEAELKLYTGDPLTIFFSVSSPHYIEQLVQYQVWLGQPEAAFQRAESVKSQTLLHHLAGRDVNFTVDFDKQSASPFVAARVDLQQAEKAWGLGLDPAREKLKEARRNYLNILMRQRIRASLKKGVAANPEWVDLKALQTLLPDDTTLVSYYGTWKQLMIWIVSRESFELKTVDISRQDLAKKVRWSIERLATRGGTRSLRRRFNNLCGTDRPKRYSVEGWMTKLCTRRFLV